MLIQELNLLVLYLQYSLWQMYTWFSVGYILEDCRSCKSLPWSQFTDPSDDPLIQEGLNLCFGKIIEVETEIKINRDSFV